MKNKKNELKKIKLVANNDNNNMKLNIEQSPLDNSKKQIKINTLKPSSPKNNNKNNSNNNNLPKKSPSRSPNNKVKKYTYKKTDQQQQQQQQQQGQQQNNNNKKGKKVRDKGKKGQENQENVAKKKEGEKKKEEEEKKQEQENNNNKDKDKEEGKTQKEQEEQQEEGEGDKEKQDTNSKILSRKQYMASRIANQSINQSVVLQSISKSPLAREESISQQSQQNSQQSKQFATRESQLQMLKQKQKSIYGSKHTAIKKKSSKQTMMRMPQGGGGRQEMIVLHDLRPYENKQQEKPATEDEVKEMEVLGFNMGMYYQDETVKNQNLLRFMVRQALPNGWKKERDPQKQVVYVNQEENIMTTQHPNLGKFNDIFYDFLDKRDEVIFRKKLEDIENEDSDKEVNKDQQGDINSSKKKSMHRNKSIMKQSMSKQASISQQKQQSIHVSKQSRSGNKRSTSHMKSIVKAPSEKKLKNMIHQDQNLEVLQQNFDENVVTCQLFQENTASLQRNEMYMEYLQGLKERKEEVEKLNFQKIRALNQPYISDYMKSFEVCTQYYTELYGGQPNKVLQTFQEESDYQRANPDEVAHNIIFLNLQDENPSFYWLARLYTSIHLPNNWKVTQDFLNNRKYYTNCNDEQCQLEVHPAYHYVQELYSKQKQQYKFMVDNIPMFQPKKRNSALNQLAEMNFGIGKFGQEVVEEEVENDENDEDFDIEQLKKQYIFPSDSKIMEFFDPLFRKYSCDIGTILYKLGCILKHTCKDQVQDEREFEQSQFSLIQTIKEVSKQQQNQNQNKQIEDEQKIVKQQFGNFLQVFKGSGNNNNEFSSHLSSRSNQNSIIVSGSNQEQQQQFQDEEEEQEGKFAKNSVQSLSKKKTIQDILKNPQQKKFADITQKMYENYDNYVYPDWFEKMQESNRNRYLTSKKNAPHDTSDEDLQKSQQQQDSSQNTNQKRSSNKHRQSVNNNLSNNQESNPNINNNYMVDSESSLDEEEERVNEMMELQKDTEFMLYNERVQFFEEQQQQIQQELDKAEVENILKQQKEQFNNNNKQGKEKQQKNQKQKQQLQKKRHKRVPSNLKDNHLLYIAEQLDLQLPQESHLLVLVTQFVIWKEEEEGEVWKYRETQEGLKYWLNLKDSKNSQQFYPYLMDLEKVIELFREVLKREMEGPKVQMKRNFLQNILNRFAIRSLKSGDKVLSCLKGETKQFVIKYFLESSQNREYFIHKYLKYNKQQQQQNDYFFEQESEQESSQGGSLQQFNQQLQQGDNLGGENNNEQQKFKLKNLMRYFRDDIEYSDKSVKNQLMFKFPWKMNVVKKVKVSKKKNDESLNDDNQKKKKNSESNSNSEGNSDENSSQEDEDQENEEEENLHQFAQQVDSMSSQLSVLTTRSQRKQSKKPGNKENNNNKEENLKANEEKILAGQQKLKKKIQQKKKNMVKLPNSYDILSQEDQYFQGKFDMENFKYSSTSGESSSYSLNEIENLSQHERSVEIVSRSYSSIFSEFRSLSQSDCSQISEYSQIVTTSSSSSSSPTSSQQQLQGEGSRSHSTSNFSTSNTGGNNTENTKTQKTQNSNNDSMVNNKYINNAGDNRRYTVDLKQSRQKKDRDGMNSQGAIKVKKNKTLSHYKKPSSNTLIIPKSKRNQNGSSSNISVASSNNSIGGSPLKNQKKQKKNSSITKKVRGKNNKSQGKKQSEENINAVQQQQLKQEQQNQLQVKEARKINLDLSELKEDPNEYTSDTPINKQKLLSENNTLLSQQQSQQKSRFYPSSSPQQQLLQQQSNNNNNDNNNGKKINFSSEQNTIMKLITLKEPPKRRHEKNLLLSVKEQQQEKLQQRLIEEAEFIEQQQNIRRQQQRDSRMKKLLKSYFYNFSEEFLEGCKEQENPRIEQRKQKKIERKKRKLEKLRKLNQKIQQQKKVEELKIQQEMLKKQQMELRPHSVSHMDSSMSIVNTSVSQQQQQNNNLSKFGSKQNIVGSNDKLSSQQLLQDSQESGSSSKIRHNSLPGNQGEIIQQEFLQHKESQNSLISKKKKSLNNLGDLIQDQTIQKRNFKKKSIIRLSISVGDQEEQQKQQQDKVNLESPQELSAAQKMKAEAKSLESRTFDFQKQIQLQKEDELVLGSQLLSEQRQHIFKYYKLEDDKKVIDEQQGDEDGGQTLTSGSEDSSFFSSSLDQQMESKNLKNNSQQQSDKQSSDDSTIKQFQKIQKKLEREELKKDPYLYKKMMVKKRYFKLLEEQEQEKEERERKEKSQVKHAHFIGEQSNQSNNKQGKDQQINKPSFTSFLKKPRMTSLGVLLSFIQENKDTREKEIEDAVEKERKLFEFNFFREKIQDQKDKFLQKCEQAIDRDKNQILARVFQQEDSEQVQKQKQQIEEQEKLMQKQVQLKNSLSSYYNNNSFLQSTRPSTPNKYSRPNTARLQKIRPNSPLNNNNLYLNTSVNIRPQSPPDQLLLLKNNNNNTNKLNKSFTQSRSPGVYQNNGNTSYRIQSPRKQQQQRQDFQVKQVQYKQQQEQQQQGRGSTQQQQQRNYMENLSQPKKRPEFKKQSKIVDEQNKVFQIKAVPNNINSNRQNSNIFSKSLSPAVINRQQKHLTAPPIDPRNNCSGGKQSRKSSQVVKSYVPNAYRTRQSYRPSTIKKEQDLKEKIFQNQREMLEQIISRQDRKKGKERNNNSDDNQEEDDDEQDNNFHDYYTNYKLNKILANLTKTQPNSFFDMNLIKPLKFQQKFDFDQQKQQNSQSNYEKNQVLKRKKKVQLQQLEEHFQVQANKELEILKQKSILRKLTLFFLDFFIQILPLSEEDKKNIKQQEGVKNYFYQCNQEFIDHIIIQTSKSQNQQIQEAIRCIFLQTEVQQEVEKQLHNHIKIKFQSQIQKFVQKNNSDNLQIMLQNYVKKSDKKQSPYLQLQQYQEDPYFEHNFIDQNDKEKQSGLKPLFSLFTTKMFVDNLYDPNMYQEWPEESAFNFEQFSDIYSDQIYRLGLRMKFEDSEGVIELVEKNEEYFQYTQTYGQDLIHQDKTKFKQIASKFELKNINQNNNKKKNNKLQEKNKIRMNFDKFKCVFLYKQLVECVELWQKMKKKDQVCRALKNELKDIHDIYRQIVYRYDCFLDCGLCVSHVEEMARRLKICLKREADLVWIAFLYCIFLVRYQKNKSLQILQVVLQEKMLGEAPYDGYFEMVLRFQRIKREFILMNFNGKQRDEYFLENSYFKFYDWEGDVFFYHNFLSQKQCTQLEKSSIYKQEKYFILEKVIFIEVLDGMVHLVQNKEWLPYKKVVIQENSRGNNVNNDQYNQQDQEDSDYFN